MVRWVSFPGCICHAHSLSHSLFSKSVTSRQSEEPLTASTSRMGCNKPLDRGDFRFSRSCFVAIAKLRVNIFSYACSITLFDFVVSLFTSYSLCFQFTPQPCESCSQILNFARALEQSIVTATGLLKFILKLGFVLALLFKELVSCLHSRRQFSLCWFEDSHPGISSI